MKTSELTGAALDWAVAQCEVMRDDYRDRGLLVHRIGYGQPMPLYSTDWSQGGPIIESEGISSLYLYVTDDPFRWAASEKPSIRNVKPKSIYGPTLLIAAMRCYVASKLGDEVEVPEELE